MATSAAAVELLGMTPASITAVEDRFDELSASGRPLTKEEHPLRRVARGEPFETEGIWRDRESGREMALRFRGRAVESHGLLEIEWLAADAERRIAARLSKLNDALLGRTPGRGVISIRELLLELVLHACEITRARYGALGVLRPDGKALKDFIYVGLPEDVARAIGHLPEGKGLLGAVIREASTIRVPHIDSDPRSVGFPASHPPMTSFLGVPLRIGKEVFGNFYVTDKQGGGAFTDEDAHLLERFSAQASLTIAYARQADQEERRLFEIVVRHAPHGIVYFPADPAAEILGNPAAERILGRITRGNDPNRTYDLMHLDGTTLTEEELPSSRAQHTEAVINAELVVERHGGGSTPVLVSAAPVRSKYGARLGAVVIFQDISALKQLQDLSRSFLALVAHDLRTPLQSVLLQLEALLRRAEGEAAQVPISTLMSMKRNGQQLDRLVCDLLDASRIDAQGVTLDLSSVSLPDLVSSIVSQMQGTMGTHSVSVEVSGKPQPIKVDARRVEQVITNLLENASKYSDEGTPIRIVVASSSNGATVSVQDQGPGIDPDELPKLFDRYFQTQRARYKGRGLGLGLFITKGFVEAHGGTITVESIPGAGSTFTVWLPAATNPPASKTP